MNRLGVLSANKELKREISNCFVEDDIWVGAASDMNAAVELFSQDRPDVVLVDVSVEDLSISELARTLSADRKSGQTPMLVMGTPDQEDLIYSAVESGGMDLLFLPVNSFEIKTRVRALHRYKTLADDFNARMFVDAVTGLSNRMALIGELSIAISEMAVYRKPLSLIRFGIMNLKRVNSDLGHAYGDTLLEDISSRLSRSVTENLGLFRGDGSEFFVLGTNIDVSDAVKEAESLISVVSQIPLGLPSEPEARVVMNAGVSGLSPDETPDQRRLMGMTDEALVAAHEQGENQVVALTLRGKDWLG